MGRLFLIEFDPAPGKTFCLCSSCCTYIALKEDFISKSVCQNNLGAFVAAVNLVVDDPAHHDRRNPNKVLAHIFCTRCYMHLGYKLVYVKRPDGVIMVTGRVFIFINKLLFWNGQQLVAAKF